MLKFRTDTGLNAVLIAAINGKPEDGLMPRRVVTQPAAKPRPIDPDRLYLQGATVFPPDRSSEHRGSREIPSP